MRTTVAKNIRFYRKLYNLSQKEAAAKVNIPRSRWGSYEEARAEPPYTLLIQICELFQVDDLKRFLTREEHQYI